MGDFEFDIDLLISLPVLWDKTDDVYKDRNETKKAWREVFVCLQEDFESLGDAQKNAFGEYCHNLLKTADLNSNYFFIICILLFIFLTFARKQFQHLLENNQLLYSLHCSLLAPHVMIVHQVHL